MNSAGIPRTRLDALATGQKSRSTPAARRPAPAMKAQSAHRARVAVIAEDTAEYKDEDEWELDAEAIRAAEELSSSMN